MSFCPGTGESPCQAVPKRREPRGHMRSSGFAAAEKSAVTAACQHLIDDFLKPRFLPTIRPTQFNYPVDILGKWHGTKYRFDLQWHRHTGEWFCLHRSLTLAEAIDTLRSEGLFHPH